MNFHQLKEIALKRAGEFIADGCTREVYKLAQDDRFVIKIERLPPGKEDGNVVGRSACLTEYNNWLRINEAGFGSWVAPCIELGGHGVYIVMFKTERTHVKNLPSQIPEFFRDRKPANWGLLNGSAVCHDYEQIKEVLKHKFVKTKWHK